ncbi:uncharacterized protein LOC144114210 [Amblyomma americanum]
MSLSSGNRLQISTRKAYLIHDCTGSTLGTSPHQTRSCQPRSLRSGRCRRCFSSNIHQSPCPAAADPLDSCRITDWMPCCSWRLLWSTSHPLLMEAVDTITCSDTAGALFPSLTNVARGARIPPGLGFSKTEKKTKWIYNSEKANGEQ